MTITTEEAERLAGICELWGMDNSAATIRSLAAERDALQARVAKLERLVQILIDEDPDDMAADAVTVLDVWRKEARAALEGKKDE